MGSNGVSYVDPFGLYKVSQCAKASAAKIKLAVPLAQAAADSLGLGDDFSQTLNYLTFRCMKKHPGHKDDNCAYNGEPHSYPFHYAEKQAFDAERQCFPNCSVAPKSDEDLRKIYPC